MAVTSKKFGTLPTGSVDCYTLDNGCGLRAEVLTYGGIIKNLYVKDKNGVATDVVLGRDTLEEYLKNDGYFGAAIGRHANRISNAEFELNGKKYRVGVNEGKNSLHGGMVGFDKRIWKAEPIENAEGTGLFMTLVSEDMEEGFPGKLEVHMTYMLTKENSLKITYRAVSDKDTVVNLTNHSYFNLAGHASGDVHEQLLQINSSFYTPNDDECMPTGEVLSVMGTPFDFRAPKPIGQDISSDFDQIAKFGGYDHNFAIDGRGFRLAAVASCPSNGITMQTYTNKPAMQLYTGNGIDTERVCKEGAKYPVHGAFCLETQFFPNSMRFAHYPSPILKAGVQYKYITEYKFI